MCSSYNIVLLSIDGTSTHRERYYRKFFFPCAFPTLYVDLGWLIVLVFEFSMFHVMTHFYVVSLDHNYNIYLIYIG